MSIQLHNINYFYGDHQALFNVDLNCTQGETLAILGPSGSGKSTLLRLLNLLELPNSGLMSVQNHQFDFSTPHKIHEQQIRQLRRQVGMVFQQYHLWPHLTVMQNLIEAPCRVLRLSTDEAKMKANNLLARLGLQTLAKRYPAHLSGGQQQRVAIARALIMEPSILLFDEPTAALDPEITAQIVHIIHELSTTGITQIIVTHEIDFARKIASNVIYMEQGKIIEQGNKELFTTPTTQAFTHYLSH